MKKMLTLCALAFTLASVPALAQEKAKQPAKKETKDTKKCSADEKKACAKDKKGGCCKK